MNNPILQPLMDLPLLTAEEEIALARRRDGGDRSAVDELVCRNQRLVFSIARRYVRDGRDIADLMGEGQIGLVTAAERFDPERGTKFSTFARWWITQSIRRNLVDTRYLIRLPAHIQEKISKIDAGLPLPRKTKPCTIEFGRRAMAAQSWSLDAPDGDPVNHPWHVEDHGTEEATAEAKARLRVAISWLPERHARVIELRYGLGFQEPMTLKLVGKIIGVTRERVRQIQDEALEAIRGLMADVA